MANSKHSRIIHSGLRMLSKNKLRTFFMMLGVIIGIAALTITLTIGNGIEKKIFDNVARFIQPNNVVITSEAIAAEGLREDESGPNTSLKIADAEALVEQLGNVTDYDYLFMMPETEMSYNGINHFSTVKGCRTQGEELWNKRVIRGRFFDKSELKGSKRVAIIGKNLANKLFGEEDPIGKQFRLSGNNFTVIGLSEPQGSDPHGNDLDDEAVIPVTTLMRRVANVDYIQAVKLVFVSEQEAAEAEATVRNILRERHAIAEGNPDDFTMMTPVQVKAMVAEMTKVFKVLLPAISGIALLAAVIVIMVLMGMAVNQRIREVGLRKAIGAKNTDISWQFMAEIIAVVLAGGLIGLIFGFLASKGMSDKLNATFYVPIQTIVVGIVLSIITGVVAGVFPARKAAKQNPVKSLKA